MLYREPIFHAAYQPIRNERREIVPAFGTPQRLLASVYPMQDTVSLQTYGLLPDEGRRVILRGRHAIAPKDGMWLSDTAAGEPPWRVLSVLAWPRYTEVVVKKDGPNQRGECPEPKTV